MRPPVALVFFWFTRCAFPPFCSLGLGRCGLQRQPDSLVCEVFPLSFPLCWFALFTYIRSVCYYILHIISFHVLAEYSSSRIRFCLVLFKLFPLGFPSVFFIMLWSNRRCQ